MQESGLAAVVSGLRSMLNRTEFYTVGKMEAKAWPISAGVVAPKAASVIHSDFEKHFIRAEVMSADEYILLGGERGCRDAGKLRVEGKDYCVRDGDILNILHSAK